jgi:hypothetical protein
LDDDRDGLTNGEEISRNLLPDQPDTDDDEINDGDEVNLYQTDPFAKDSDGDSLPDGLEVQSGLNPLNDDSDGDGALDNVDPEPLRAPTATPTPTITPDFGATATAVTSMTVEASTRVAQALNATATSEAAELFAQQTRDAEIAAQQAAQAQAAQTATAIVASANATAAAIQAIQDANATAQAAAFATAQAAANATAQAAAWATQQAAAHQTAAAEATRHAEENQPTHTPTPTEEPHQPQQPLFAEIVQTGAGHNGDSVSGALVFQVIAFDPNVGSNDGDGIDNVRMQIFRGDHKVYERQENNAAYCAFSGGEPDCNIWFFHDHDNEWPDGDDIENDTYTLRARVRAHSGQEVTLERHISISN